MHLHMALRSTQSGEQVQRLRRDVLHLEGDHVHVAGQRFDELAVVQRALEAADRR